MADPSPRLAAAGPEVESPVGARHHVGVVLDHDDRVPPVHEPIEHVEELADVLEVETRRRLVQQIERPSGLDPRELRGELHPLRLAARERGRRLAEVDVAELTPASVSSLRRIGGTAPRRSSASSTVISSTSAIERPLYVTSRVSRL